MNSRNTLITLFVCLGAACAAHAQTITITSMGAYNDGSNVEATTAAIRNVLNTYPNAKIIFPAGTYSVDNSNGQLVIYNFNGELEFQGNATLMFQTTNHGGLAFQGGTGARIHGMHGNFAVAPTFRGEDEFDFTSMIDLTIDNGIAQNSPGVGFLITLCVRPKASNITVSNTIADGFAFANSQDAELTNYTSEYTTDNALAFYNYNNYTDLDGVIASNIHIIEDTGAHGIAVVGTSNVVVSNFTVDTTAGSGIWVSNDSSYNMRTPSNIVIQHGAILNAGILGTAGNTYGIEYDLADNVTFSDIRIVGSANRGVSGQSTSGHFRFDNITVVGNLASDAFVIAQTPFVEISDCVSENSPNNGFSFSQVTTLIARNLKVINASAQNSMNRAIWFQNGNVLLASGLMVIDDRSTPLGFVVGASDSATAVQKGSIQGVTSAIAGGALVTNAYSPGVAWSNVH